MVLGVLVVLSGWVCLALGQPVYPLYAIDSVSHTCKSSVRCQPVTPADAEVIVTNFSYVHGGYKNSTLWEFRHLNPSFRAVSYINSHSADADHVETVQGGRMGVAFYVMGTLTSAISTSDSSLTIQLGKKSAPPKASTAPGNVSTKDGYVTFLRLGSELLRINKVAANVDDGTVNVVVTRAFDGSQAESHDTNATIFAPVYKGNSHPGGNGLAYCLDPAQDFGVALLANYTVKVVLEGYTGSWLDCFGLGLLKANDVAGQSVHQWWNFESGQPYTKETMLLAQKRRLTKLFETTHSQLGSYPTILANNVGHSFQPENGNGRQFLIPNETEHFRPLDGYCLESFAGYETSTNDSDSCDIEYLKLIWQPTEKWLNNLQTVMAASQEKLAVLPMIASAGCQSPALEVSPLRNQFETYAYASFLLAVEDPSGPVKLGVPAFYRHDNKRYAYVHPRYFYKIGRPQRTVPPDQVGSYKLAEPHTTYARPFSNGLVLVNPSNMTDSDVKLNRLYFNPETKTKVNQLDVAAQSGYVLLLSED